MASEADWQELDQRAQKLLKKLENFTSVLESMLARAAARRMDGWNQGDAGQEQEGQS